MSEVKNKNLISGKKKKGKKRQQVKKNEQR